MPTEDTLCRLLTKEWLEQNDAPAVEPEEQEFSSQHNHEIGFVTYLFQLCMAHCSSLLKLLDTTRGISRSGLRQLRDSQHKFILIEDGFAHGKLETCLGIDEELRLSVISLLIEVGSHLVKLSEIFAPETNGKKSLDISLRSDELKTHLTRAKLIVQQPPSEYEHSTSSSDNESIQVTSKSLRSGSSSSLRSLLHNLDLLMDLCPTLEQTYKAQQSITRHMVKAPNFHTTPSAVPYVQVVRDKFPKATKSVIERLGEANWERHERIRKVKAEQSNFSLPDQVVIAQPTKSQFHPISTFNDSALGSSVATPSERAATVVSHSSFSSSKGDSEKGHFRVPNIPAGAFYGEAFVCPYCTSTLRTIRNRIDWKLHVFADLQAYVCVYDDCPDMLKTFTSRKAWFEHEIAFHLSRRGFQCSMCSTLLSHEDEFLVHAFDAHNVTSETSELKSAILATASRSFPKIPDEVQCPLCLQSDFSKLRGFATHLGRHLEEIALCALPPDDLDTDDEKESSTTSGRESHTDAPVIHHSYSFDHNTDQTLVPGDILIVCQNFTARADDELTLHLGDKVELIKTDGDLNDGWYLGKELLNGGVGLFPKNHTVKILLQSATPKESIQTSSDAGCLTCRNHQTMCDMGLPNCQNCEKASRECIREVQNQIRPGYEPRANQYRRIGFKDDTRAVMKRARSRHNKYFRCTEPECTAVLESESELAEHRIRTRHISSTFADAFEDKSVRLHKVRVKLYELKENDWYNHGTGFCYIEGAKPQPRLSVYSEDYPEKTLFSSWIDEKVGYQKQQDTLIVWTEPSGVDMALSFQEPTGCDDVWKSISETISQQSQRRAAREKLPELTPEDNKWINVRAAEMARHTSNTDMRQIINDMDPRIRESLKTRNIDPVAYHFRIMAIAEFRLRQKANVELPVERELLNRGSTKQITSQIPAVALPQHLDASFPCIEPTCPSTFEFESDLERHIQEIHRCKLQFKRGPDRLIREGTAVFDSKQGFRQV